MEVYSINSSSSKIVNRTLVGKGTKYYEVFVVRYLQSLFTVKLLDKNILLFLTKCGPILQLYGNQSIDLPCQFDFFHKVSNFFA